MLGQNQEIEFKWSVKAHWEFKKFLQALRGSGLQISRPKNFRITDYYVQNLNILKQTKRRYRIRNIKLRWELTGKTSSKIRLGFVSRAETTEKLKRVRNIGQALRQCQKILGKKLKVLFTIQNKRTLILAKKKRLQIEASFDQVKIKRGKKIASMKEIEFELKNGSKKEFRKLARVITKSARITPAKKSKVATALSL